MEMAQQVRTPLLALFVHFCSWIGYPTEETGLQQWDSSFVLTAKIAAHGIAFYGLFTLDAYNIETISHDPNYRKHKSLFGLVVDCLLRHLFPVTFVMNSIFYFRNGPQLVRLLDSECFYRFYQFSPFKRVFGCIITITVMVYTITYHTILFELARYRFSLVKMLYIFAIFLLDSQFQLLWGVIFYCKYATLRTLEGLHQKMLHNQPNIERKIIWNVQRLAYANYKLNQLTSPLMLFFVISHVIDFLATLFLMIKFNLFWENLGTLTIMLVMISTVIHFSLSIRGQLRQIQSSIVERHHLCAGFTRRSTEFSAYRRGLWIRVYQLEIYFEYFPLKLFNLCTIDLCLLLKTAVLVFNCFLVTIQTDESSFRQSLAK